MSEVRRHQRVTASGKRTTVQHHTRGGERTRREDEAEAAREAWADRNAPHVSTLPPSEPGPQDESWWDDDEPQAEAWMADDEEPLRDSEGRLLGTLPMTEESAEAMKADAQARIAAQRDWTYCDCVGSHRPGCPNGKPGGFPPLPDDADEVEHEGHTFKVNRAPAYQPQGDHDFAKAEPAPVARPWKEMSRDERKQAVQRYKDAREHLGAYYCDTEDDEYHRRNDAVIEAGKALPWWRTGG